MRVMLRTLGGALLGLFLAVAPAVAGLHDMVEVSVTGNPGTGTFTLGAAIAPFVGPATGGVISGETVTYAAQDTAGNWERGRGVWTSGGTNGTLTRAVVLLSTNANALVNFSTTSPTVWITIAAEDAVTTVYPNIELSLNSQPLCSLSDAATILVAAGPACASDATKGIAYDSLTLTASGHVLGCPTGATVSGSGILLRINEGSGPFKISPAGCYYFPSSGMLDSQGNLVLSGIANGINQFYCQLQGVSTGNGFPVQYECGSLQTGLGSATVYVANAPTLGSGCNGPVSTCTVATQVTAGDIVAIWAQDCGNNSNCSSGTLVSLAATPASGTGLSGCTVFTGSEGGANGFFGHWVFCTVTASGTPTITVTYSSATAVIISLVAIDLHNAAASPDAGIGHVASGSSGTSASDTTNGNTQQSNGFLLSGLVPISSTSITPGGTSILNNVGNETLIQSQNVYAPGASASATATFSPATNWVMSAVEVLHK